VTKIVLAAPQVSEPRVAEMRERFPNVQFVVPASREEVPAAVADADAFFGSIRPEEFAAAKKLRWIQASSAGVEWVARVPALIQSDVDVTNMRGAHAATIAEHTFALLLALTRALPEYAAFQQRQEWGRGQVRDRMRGIKGLTMGIVGFGNIGRAIAHRAVGFEMQVLAVDAQSVPPSDGVGEVWPLSRLNDLCRESDVPTISAPITRETRGMVGPEQIGLLKDGSYVLALSRGGIVDEPALIAALESGKLAGAGLDVTATEPLPEGDPLWKAPHLIITPHTSAASTLTSDLVWSIFAENVDHFVKGEPLTNICDKELGY
jgi:phosphoglycerate dehydrogenase-like enzyme